MRLRLKNVQQSEKQTEEKPVLNLKDKEYLSVNEAAIVLGLSRRSAYNLIYKGILRATRFSEKLTIIKRSDIEAMFGKGTAYQKQERKTPSPVGLFYTTKEIMEKYKYVSRWYIK